MGQFLNEMLDNSSNVTQRNYLNSLTTSAENHHRIASATLGSLFSFSPVTLSNNANTNFASAPPPLPSYLNSPFGNNSSENNPSLLSSPHSHLSSSCPVSAGSISNPSPVTTENQSMLSSSLMHPSGVSNPVVVAAAAAAAATGQSLLRANCYDFLYANGANANAISGMQHSLNPLHHLAGIGSLSSQLGQLGQLNCQLSQLGHHLNAQLASQHLAPLNAINNNHNNVTNGVGLCNNTHNNHGSGSIHSETASDDLSVCSGMSGSTKMDVEHLLPGKSAVHADGRSNGLLPGVGGSSLMNGSSHLVGALGALNSAMPGAFGNGFANSMTSAGLTNGLTGGLAGGSVGGCFSSHSALIPAFSVSGLGNSLNHQNSHSNAHTPAGGSELKFSVNSILNCGNVNGYSNGVPAIKIENIGKRLSFFFRIVFF